MDGDYRVAPLQCRMEQRLDFIEYSIMQSLVWLLRMHSEHVLHNLMPYIGLPRHEHDDPFDAFRALPDRLDLRPGQGSALAFFDRFDELRHAAADPEVHTLRRDKA